MKLRAERLDASRSALPGIPIHEHSEWHIACENEKKDNCKELAKSSVFQGNLKRLVLAMLHYSRAIQVTVEAQDCRLLISGILLSAGQLKFSQIAILL